MPTQTQSIEVSGVKVLIEGAGPKTIVMVHGWPDTYRLWDGQVAALSPTYRCVRFTLPGFEPTDGRRPTSLSEMVRLIANVVAAVSPNEKVIMMLHDWGCIFGYQFIAAYPERIERVIGVDIGDIRSKAYRAELSVKSKFLIFGYQYWLAMAWSIGGSLGDRMTRFMARAVKAKSDPAFICCNMNYPYHITWMGSYGSYKALVNFKPSCPMLFIYGSRKVFNFHSSVWETWLPQQPNSRVLGLPTGHWVMLGQSDAFNQAVLDWLKEG